VASEIEALTLPVPWSAEESWTELSQVMKWVATAAAREAAPVKAKAPTGARAAVSAAEPTQLAFSPVRSAPAKSSGRGAGGERAGDAEGGLGGAADDGFFPDGAGVADDVAEAERVAGRGEVVEEGEVGKEAPISLQATLSVDGRQRVGERREMKRPLRSRRVLGVVERALPAA
jgi:hypothetical protein